MDEDIIEDWFRARPDLGIGVPTGSLSDLVVIDVDARDGKPGFESLDRLEQKLGPLPKTRSTRTPSGGAHFFFKYEQGIRSSQDKLGKGIDVRGDGGAIVLPPSHALYEWTEPDEPIANLPPEWIEYLRKLKSTNRYHAAIDQKHLDELSNLDPFEYEQKRQAVAKELGVRVSALDREVMERREQLRPTRRLFETIEPWNEVVDGAELLGELWDTFDRYIVLPKWAVTAVILWLMHAHAHDAANHSPILIITSPTKRCGKTTLLSLLNKLVPKPLPSANITPATIFRAIELWKPTLLIDEADAFINDKNEIRGVLDSGHERSQAFVLRCVGDDLIPTQFSTWAPKAIAVIGRLHPTLEDRSIKIELKRRLPSEYVERIPRDAGAFTELRRKCARWSKDHIEALRVARPKVPKELHDRARDNWDALAAIADACGGKWPESVREAARQLSTFDDDETHAIMLLEDLEFVFQRIFRTEQRGNLSSKEIVHQLEEMEDRPWPDYYHGKPISPRGVAKLLKDFKIYPRQVLVRGERVNGYRREQFKQVFKRYLQDERPISSASSEKPESSTSSDDNKTMNDDHPS